MVAACHPGTATEVGDETPASAAASAPSQLELHFVVDRSGLPPLTYGEITLKVDALGAAGATVRADGTEIPSRVDRGKVVFTTDASQVIVTLDYPTGVERAGTFERAALKDDRAWAWSHGFDDNTMLQAGIEAFRARGWRATLFMICEHVDDTRQEGWIVDAPGLKRLLGEGWGVGNHSWDHQMADDRTAARESIVRCSERLSQIVSASPRPGYRVIAFASPAFDARYAPIVRSLHDEGVTDLLYVESGGDALVQVDPGVVDAYDWAVPFDTDLVLGRYTPIGWDAPATIAVMDSIASGTNASTHLWFNTIAHGSNEGSLVPVLEHVYSRYGPGGTNEVWVAPSDEVFSHLLVRDRATVDFLGTRAP